MPNFSDNEVPAGSINGINKNFTWLNAPNPTGSLQVYRNGVLQLQGTDYTQGTNISSFVSAPSLGDDLVGFYRY